MSPKKRKFRRPSGERRYRKMFVLATEGTKTEVRYFSIFNNRNTVVHIEFLKKRGDSAPLQVLARMKNHLRKESLRDSDEAWLVVDKDQWTDDQLSELHEWAQEADNYGFALSNPKFEFWLLLHFEDGSGVSNSQTCSKRLERYLPEYDKDINMRKISDDMIEKAVERAKRRDTPACHDWPKDTGTTVYRLVENIMKLRNSQG